MKKLKSIWAIFTKSLSTREVVVVVLLASTLAPLFRGGRDPLGLLYISTITFLVLLFSSRLKELSFPKISKSNLILPLVVVVIYGLSLFYTSDFHQGLFSVLALSNALILGVLSIGVLTNKKRTTLFWQVAVFFGVVTALFGLQQYLTIPFDRSTSFFYWPNPLAIYLGLLTALSAYYFIESKSWYWLMASLIMGPVLILTQSLASFVFILAGIAALAIIQRKQLRQYVAVSGLIIVCSMLLALASVYIKENVVDTSNIGTPDQLQELVTTKTGGLGDRFNYIESSFELIKDNPIAGTGAGSFLVEYPGVQKSAAAGVTNPHNAYVHMAQQTGVITVLVFVAFVVQIYHQLIKDRKKGYQAIYPVMLGVFLAHMGFYQTDRYPTLLILFAMLISLTLLQIKAKKVKPSKYLIPVLSGVALVMVIVSGIVFASRSYADEANKAASNFEVGRAIRLYEQAISLPIVEPTTYSNLGWQYFLLGEYDNALKYYDKAIALDEKRAENYFRKGFLLVRDGQYQQARENIEKAIELDPLNRPRYFVVYSDALIELGEIDKAKQALEGITSEYTDDVLISRGALNKLDLDVALLHFQRGKLAYIEGDFNRAKTELERAVSLRPEHELSKRLLEQTNLNLP